MSSTVNGEGWVTTDTATVLLGITRQELHRRTRPGDGDFVVSKLSDNGRRVYSVSSMPDYARQRYLDSRSPNLATSEIAPAEPEGNGQQPLFNRTPEQQAIDQAIGHARASLDPSQDANAFPKFKAIQMTENHDYAVLGKTTSEFVAGIAAQVGLSPDRFKKIRSDYLRTAKTEGYEAAYKTLVKDKPGPDKGSHPKIPLWLQDYIRVQWEDNQRLPTRRQVWRNALKQLALSYWREKARALGASYNYGPEPTDAELDEFIRTELPSDRKIDRTTVLRYINGNLFGDANPKRRGAQAVKVAAGFIPRSYEDEPSGDAWCIDEWEIDCYPYSDADHRVVYNWGTKNPIDGRPNPVLHVLTVIDERSTCILDWIVTDRLEDDTLTLAERILRNGHPAPLRLVADRAGRFRQLSYGHMQVRHTAELMDKLDGPLGRLGVIPRGSPEKNPRGNRIERAIHGEYARNARRDFGLAWRPPRKSDLREVTGIDERVANHYRYHCGGARNSERAGEPSELIPVSAVIACVGKWVEEINNGVTNANGCHGLTRLAAFNHFRPPAEEIAKRRPAQSILDEIFAERFKRTVPEHSMLGIEGDWYSAPELAYHIGEDVQVVRFRRDLEQVFVDCADNTRIVARRTPRVGIHDDQLGRESELLARRRKALAGTAEAVIPASAVIPAQAGIHSDNPHASLAPPPEREWTEGQYREFRHKPKAYDLRKEIFGEGKA